MEDPFKIYFLVSNSTKKLEPKDVMGEDVQGLVGLIGPFAPIIQHIKKFYLGLDRGIQ